MTDCRAEKAVNAYNTLKGLGMQNLTGTVTRATCAAAEYRQDRKEKASRSKRKSPMQ